MLTVDQNQCEINMSETYTRRTEDERYQIYEDKFMGLSHRQIAKKLNRHHSSISREIARNRGLRGYRPRQAHQFAQQRHLLKPKHIKMTAEVKELVSQHIKKDWSPEQIQGRLRKKVIPWFSPVRSTALSKTIKPLAVNSTSTSGILSPIERELENLRREVKSPGEYPLMIGQALLIKECTLEIVKQIQK